MDDDFNRDDSTPRERERWSTRDVNEDFFARGETITEQEIEADIRDLRNIREENLDVLGELMMKYKEIRDIHLELDDLIEDYYEFMETRDISGRITEEYSELLDDHIEMLDEQEDDKRRGMYSRFIGGTGLLATGMGLAELYLPEEGFLEFYREVPQIASESPEI